MSRGLKSLLRSRALARMAGGYLAFCDRTARWRIEGLPALRDLAEQREGFVMAFWHECLPLMPLAWARFWAGLEPSIPRKPGMVLVSKSRDGALIAGLMEGYGLTPVNGSTSRGGRAAALELLRGIRGGGVAVVVPDGPRGPRREVSEGGVRLAAMAGRPIVPCAAFAARSRRLRSWDRMILPLPFSRCVAVVGEPIRPEGRDPAALAALLSESLCRAVAGAEAACEDRPRIT